MTVEEKLVSMLMAKGVSPRNAVTALEATKAEIGDGMTGQWTDNIEGYPVQMLEALWYLVQGAAGLLDE